MMKVVPPLSLARYSSLAACAGGFAALILVAFTSSRAQAPAQALLPPGRSVPAQNLAQTPARLPAERRYLPASISEPLSSMRIQVVRETANDCLYRSGHFEFKTPVKLGTAAMTAICRAFESTHELVSRLPWGITPRSLTGPYFRAELFKTRQDYLAAGAPPWSAAFYSLQDYTFRIPFEEVGVVSKGSTFYLSGAINNDTITHEVTHQMMQEYLRFMPLWMAEGTAEYTSKLPYDNGRYMVSNAVEGFKQMRRQMGKVKRRGNTMTQYLEAKWIGVPELWRYNVSIIEPMDVPENPPSGSEAEDSTTSSPRPGGRSVAPTSFPPTQEMLAGRYYSSHALVFYFMHFDGDGKATRLKRYFDAIHQERERFAGYDAEMARLRPQLEKYMREMEAFRQLPGVRATADGKLSFPATLTPPALPALPKPPARADRLTLCTKHLPVLLDGRTLAQLDEEVRAAFAKAEIPL